MKIQLAKNHLTPNVQYNPVQKLKAGSQIWKDYKKRLSLEFCFENWFLVQAVWSWPASWLAFFWSLSCLASSSLEPESWYTGTVEDSPLTMLLSSLVSSS